MWNWRSIANLRVFKSLRMENGSVIETVSASGVVSTVDLTELTALDGLTASVAELNLMDGVTATMAEINSACDVSTMGETLITTRLLTLADHGKTFVLGHATGFTTTLPLLSTSAGFKCKFIVGVPPTTGNCVVVANATDAAKIWGILDDAEAATVAESIVAMDQINFVQNSAIVGAWVTFENPAGTAWYVDGNSTLAASITGTT